MTMKRALQVILGVSVFGLLFSGVLTYHELFGAAAATCPAPGAPGTVFGYPACVYGFFMYLTITGLAIAGLWGSLPLKGRRIAGEKGAQPLGEVGAVRDAGKLL
jgi:hypothetical protein